MIKLRRKLIWQGNHKRVTQKQFLTARNKWSYRHLLVFIVAFGILGGIILRTGNAANPQVGRYDVYEITLPYSSTSVGNVWEDVTATVDLTAPGKSLQIKGFYYSANTWKARIAPDVLGTWSWSASVTGPNGTVNSSGAFDVIDTGNPGFVQPNPSNPRRMVTSNGQPYIPVGMGDCVGINNFDANGAMVNGPAFDLTTNKSADSYFSTFSDAGINLFRMSLDNCAFKVYNTIGSPKNTYSELNSKALDSFLQKARQYNIRVYLVIFGFNPSYPSATVGSPEMLSVERYAKYMVDRYGAYVDFWELDNEASPTSVWKDDIAQTIRARDPYQHRISSSWESQNDSNIEVISPHWYETENETGSDAATKSHIDVQRPYNKLIIFGEQGNGTCNWDNRSAVRMRLRLWSAMFNEGALIFWHTGGTKVYCNGAANLYIGQQERAYIKTLQTFGKDLTADAVIESSSTAVIPLRSYALAGANKAWAYVTNYSDHTNPSVGGKLTLSSPVSGSARFISTKDGSILGYQAVSAGSNTLNLPTFNTDIAVEITSASFRLRPKPRRRQSVLACRQVAQRSAERQ